jgi:hypothetical protein
VGNLMTVTIAAGTLLLGLLIWLVKAGLATEGVYLRDRAAELLVSLAALLQPARSRVTRRQEWCAELAAIRENPRYEKVSGLSFALGCCIAAAIGRGKDSELNLRDVWYLSFCVVLALPTVPLESKFQLDRGVLIAIDLFLVVVVGMLVYVLPPRGVRRKSTTPPSRQTEVG